MFSFIVLPFQVGEVRRYANPQLTGNQLRNTTSRTGRLKGKPVSGKTELSGRRGSRRKR
jgi:hypothetical protein